jgi:hypothetical protein
MTELGGFEAIHTARALRRLKPDLRRTRPSLA